jgi:hypothetical protein
MLWDIIFFAGGCCVGATFSVTILKWMDKAKKKAKQVANDISN